MQSSVDVLSYRDKRIMSVEQTELFRTPGQFIFKGVPFTYFVNRRVLESKEIVQCRQDDVFVVTYPKSGTTWTTEMVSLILNKGNDEANRVVNQLVRSPMVEMYVESIEKWKWLFCLVSFLKQLVPKFITNSVLSALPESREMSALNGLQHMETLPSPRLLKSHLPYKFFPDEALKKKCKIVYVARNPKDTAVSYYHFYKLSPGYGFADGTWDLFFDLFTHGRVDYGDWFDHVLEWWGHRNDDNVLFLKYEDIKKNPRDIVKTIANFLNVTLTENTIEKIVECCSFERMKANPAVNMDRMFKPNYTISPTERNSFMRKGVVGGWRKHFTVSQNTEFDSLYQERMVGSDLEFEW
ncbi:sulfotransferase 1B1-like isoform X2 [Ptychodera flava]|uniref:sulfotransferase 1B1-like isoform X2 n=1 Tax=Ptychodera flava TaxID=63121 RepID=UPI003969EE96